MRERYERFAKYVVEELAVEGRDMEDSIMAAGKRMHWHCKFGPMKPRSVLRKAKELLSRPDVTEAIMGYFEIAADWSPVDAAQKLVAWIEGNVTHEVTTVTKDGEVVKTMVKLPPSEQALNKYFSMTMPKPTKRVEIDQRTTVAKVISFDEPPKLRARVIDVDVKELTSGE